MISKDQMSTDEYEKRVDVFFTMSNFVFVDVEVVTTVVVDFFKDRQLHALEMAELPVKVAIPAGSGIVLVVAAGAALEVASLRALAGAEDEAGACAAAPTIDGTGAVVLGTKSVG